MYTFIRKQRRESKLTIRDMEPGKWFKLAPGDSVALIKMSPNIGPLKSIELNNFVASGGVDVGCLVFDPAAGRIMFLYPNTEVFPIDVEVREL